MIFGVIIRLKLKAIDGMINKQSHKVTQRSHCGTAMLSSCSEGQGINNLRDKCHIIQSAHR